jgi:hypothetical protein
MWFPFPKKHLNTGLIEDGANFLKIKGKMGSCEAGSGGRTGHLTAGWGAVAVLPT